MCANCCMQNHWCIQLLHFLFVFVLHLWLDAEIKDRYISTYGTCFFFEVFYYTKHSFNFPKYNLFTWSLLAWTLVNMLAITCPLLFCSIMIVLHRAENHHCLASSWILIPNLGYLFWYFMYHIYFSFHIKE